MPYGDITMNKFTIVTPDMGEFTFDDGCFDTSWLEQKDITHSLTNEQGITRIYLKFGTCVHHKYLEGVMSDEAAAGEEWVVGGCDDKGNLIERNIMAGSIRYSGSEDEIQAYAVNGNTGVFEIDSDASEYNFQFDNGLSDSEIIEYDHVVSDEVFNNLTLDKTMSIKECGLLGHGRGMM